MRVWFRVSFVALKLCSNIAFSVGETSMSISIEEIMTDFISLYMLYGATEDLWYSCRLTIISYSDKLYRLNQCNNK